MAPGQPPPPPPPPGQRGPPPQGMPGAGPPGQHPGPANRPPMQGPPPFLSQMRQPVNSTRVVDISPRPMRDAASCRKELTTYQVYTIKKAIPNGREKPTWARSEVVQEKIPKSEIVKDIKKLNEGRNSVADKKASLAPFMQGQIVNLIDDLSTREHDANFEWSLVQLDTKRRVISKRPEKKETVTMTVYVSRTPLEGLDPIMLHQTLERNRIERLQAQNRPPPQQQQQQPQQPPPQQQPPRPPPPPPPPNMPQQGGKPPGGGGNGGGMQFVKLPANFGPKSPKSPKSAHGRGPKKYYDSASSRSSRSDSMSDSGSESDSDRSFSSRTTPTGSSVFSKGDRREKQYNLASSRNRSRSRPRQHTKKYHMEGRSPSPPRRITVVQGPEPVPVQAPRPYAPEVPRAPPQQPQMPSFETVDAAYHAGKIDADLERRGQEERERFQAPPQAPQHPIIIERQIPVVIEQPREPRAIISYGRAERERDRLPDSPTRSWAETRYSEPLISPYATHRYIEDLRDTRPPMRVQREYRAETRGFRPEFRDIGYDRDEFHDREFSPEPQRFRPEPREFRPEPRGYQPDFRETRRGSDFFDHEDEEEFIPQPRPFMERRATEPRARMSYYPREPEPHPFAPLPRSYPLPVRPGPSPGW